MVVLFKVNCNKDGWFKDLKFKDISNNYLFFILNIIWIWPDQGGDWVERAHF